MESEEVESSGAASALDLASSNELNLDMNVSGCVTDRSVLEYIPNCLAAVLVFLIVSLFSGDFDGVLFLYPWVGLELVGDGV
jgi:hypothetical protein